MFLFSQTSHVKRTMCYKLIDGDQKIFRITRWLVENFIRTGCTPSLQYGVTINRMKPVLMSSCTDDTLIALYFQNSTLVILMPIIPERNTKLKHGIWNFLQHSAFNSINSEIYTLNVTLHRISSIMVMTRGMRAMTRHTKHDN